MKTKLEYILIVVCLILLIIVVALVSCRKREIVRETEVSESSETYVDVESLKSEIKEELYTEIYTVLVPDETTPPNEDMESLRQEVENQQKLLDEQEKQLQSQQAEINRLQETTKKETKQAVETTIVYETVIATPSPTPTPEPTPKPIKDIYVTVSASEGRISASNKIRQALEDAGYKIAEGGDLTAGIIPGESQLKMNPGSYVLDLDICTVHITVVE